MPAPVKRALLIGIDAYQPAKIPKLHGCVNDAQLMQSILAEQFGFASENVTLLANDQATRDNILGALDALVAATAQDDVVVFYYAGHGSQMTDREGDEASGLDNTIMPVESEGWSGMNHDITDDEIHLRLIALGAKTAYTTLIVDACHSATITRDAFGEASRSVPADTRPISELPPSPIPAASRSAGAPGAGRGPSGWMPLAEQYVLIAGCRDEETSFEYRPPEGNGLLVHGALTYFLGQELRRATPGTSYRDVFERAAARVTANDARQHPQMEGRVDRALFGVTDLTPMKFTRVESRTGDGVTLGAGAAHGMTAGSVWAVYPQGTKHADGAEPIGTVEITEVRAVRATARVTSETTPGAIVADSRAVEQAHAYGALRLRAQTDASVAAAEAKDVAQAKALRRLLADSRLVEVVGADDASATARIYLVAPRDAVRDGDPVPQLGVVQSPTWAVVGSNGQLQMPAKRLDEYADVAANLDTLARYRQALELENPNPASALRGKFDLDLLRRGADGSWIVAEPATAGGLPVYEEGDDIAFEIKSRHEAKAYVSLLDFGPTGSISLIFPAPNASDQVTPNVRFQIGTRQGEDAFSVSYPSAFPFAGQADDPVDAIETVKLFVTTTDAGFTFLEQESMRGSTPRRTGALQLLWETALGEGGMRDITRKPVPVDTDDWTTVVKPFVIRRKGGATRPTTGAASLGATTATTAEITPTVATVSVGTNQATATGVAGGGLAATS